MLRTTWMRTIRNDVIASYQHELFKTATVKKSRNQLRVIFNHSPHRRTPNRLERKGNFMG